MRFYMIMLLALPVLVNAQKSKKGRIFYGITVYHFTGEPQEKELDNYLEKGLLPALHRQGTPHIGVFKPMANDTASDKKVYILVPYKTLNQVLDETEKLSADKEYLENGKDFLDAPYNEPAFTRKEVILLQAFPTAPMLQVPQLKSPVSERVYEMRSYEGASQKLHINKVHMFNEGGEVPLFDRLQFNGVFYGTVISGSRMPNLMYMTCFENMSSRDEHWKSFGSDPVWKELSAMPGYKNNVSRNETIFMKATAYSDY